MKVLFATSNPMKIISFKERLSKYNIEFDVLADYKLDKRVKETGKNALENAILKAKGYYDLTKVLTIAMDDELFIEGLPVGLEPGVFVKRINGKELSDEEMIEHYGALIKEYGGKLKAHWNYGMVVCSDKGLKSFTWKSKDFYFISTPCKEINKGHPLNSLSIDIETGKYIAEFPERYRASYNDEITDEKLIVFLLNAIMELKM